jgi:integrase
MIHTHVGANDGWLHVGYEGSRWRNITLLDEAREPLYTYLRATRDTTRLHVFLSKRDGRLTEQGIHYWFRTLKAQATRAQAQLIQNLTFHDLRSDFAHRAREMGWSIEVVENYLGLANKKGVLPTF